MSPLLWPARRWVLLNLLLLCGYGLLSLGISAEKGHFPVALAFYLSVHGIGLVVVALVQRAIRNFVLSRSLMLSGAGVLAAGWILLLLLF